MSNINEDSIRLVKLKNGEDVIAFVEDHGEFLELTRPIQLLFESLDEIDSEQVVNVREWLPPLIADTESVMINKDNVLFVVEVKKTFSEHFMTVSRMFFEYSEVVNDERDRKRLLQETADQTVVSLEDILKNLKKH
jgi:hypothetical protein